MSDIDLLKWLRELAQEPEFVARWLDYCPFTEAADEIEKLRALLSEGVRRVDLMCSIADITIKNPPITKEASLAWCREAEEALKGGEDETT